MKGPASLPPGLILAGVAATPTPEIELIAAEIEVDRKREARAKELNAAAAVKATGAQFMDLLAQLSRLAQPAAPSRAR